MQGLFYREKVLPPVPWSVTQINWFLYGRSTEAELASFIGVLSSEILNAVRFLDAKYFLTAIGNRYQVSNSV